MNDKRLNDLLWKDRKLERLKAQNDKPKHDHTGLTLKRAYSCDKTKTKTRNILDCDQSNVLLAHYFSLYLAAFSFLPFHTVDSGGT